MAKSIEQTKKLAELRELVAQRMKQVDDDQALSGPPQLLQEFSLPEMSGTDSAQ